MGQIQIPTKGRDVCYWSDYMGQKLQEVVQDWIDQVEAGRLVFWAGTNDLISAEHLRIAKRFLEGDVPVV